MEDPDSTQPQQVLSLEVLQPFLFGKVGLAYAVNSYHMKYLIYGNYIYGPGLVNETLAYDASDRKWTFEHLSPHPGFEIGAQVKFRNPDKWSNKEYGQYIKESSYFKSTVFSGMWAEFAYKSGKSNLIDFETYKQWDFKIGGLLNWQKEYKHFFYNTTLGIGVGKAMARLDDPSRKLELQVDNFLFVFKLGVKLGLKL